MLKVEGLSRKHIIYMKHIKNKVMPHGRHIYYKASDIENATMCAYPNSDDSLTQRKCVLRCCAKCPHTNLPEQETNKNMKNQHPQLGFTFITLFDVVLLMVEFC